MCDVLPSCKIELASFYLLQQQVWPCCELHHAPLKIYQIPEAAATPIVMREGSNERLWNFCTVWMRALASLEHV